MQQSVQNKGLSLRFSLALRLLKSLIPELFCDRASSSDVCPCAQQSDHGSMVFLPVGTCCEACVPAAFQFRLHSFNARLCSEKAGCHVRVGPCCSSCAPRKLFPCNCSIAALQDGAPRCVAAVALAHDEGERCCDAALFLGRVANSDLDRHHVTPCQIDLPEFSKSRFARRVNMMEEVGGLVGLVIVIVRTESDERFVSENRSQRSQCGFRTESSGTTGASDDLKVLTLPAFLQDSAWFVDLAV